MVPLARHPRSPACVSTDTGGGPLKEKRPVRLERKPGRVGGLEVWDDLMAWRSSPRSANYFYRTPSKGDAYGWKAACPREKLAAETSEGVAGSPVRGLDFPERRTSRADGYVVAHPDADGLRGTVIRALRQYHLLASEKARRSPSAHQRAAFYLARDLSRTFTEVFRESGHPFTRPYRHHRRQLGAAPVLDRLGPQNVENAPRQ